MAEHDEKVKVFMSSYVLAKILSLASKADSKEEGLLQGCSKDCKVSKITDSYHDDDFVKTEMTIQTVTRSNKTFSFYDSFGKIDAGRFQKRYTEAQNSIGWYVIRPRTKPFLSLREKIVIKNLLNSKLYNCERLVFLLVTTSMEENMATFNFNYKFYICEKDKLPVPFKCSIINLGDGITQQDKYKQHSRLLSSQQGITSSFNEVLKDRESSKFFSNTGSSELVDNSFSLFKKTLQLMKTVKNETSQAVQDYQKLHKEFQQLKQQKT